MSSTVRLTYFVEVLSSWCHWAEPTWAELNLRFSDRVTFDWKITLMPPAAFPESREQCDNFYRRSGIVRLEPSIATIEAMLKDADRYASFHSHFDIL